MLLVPTALQLGEDGELRVHTKDQLFQGQVVAELTEVLDQRFTQEAFANFSLQTKQYIQTYGLFEHPSALWILPGDNQRFIAKRAWGNTRTYNDLWIASRWIPAEAELVLALR